jgi:hypothetical protein
VGMLPNEMPKYHVAHSMEANNGGMEDINTSICHCGSCQWGSKFGFNDQAPYNYGLLKERTMIHHQIHHSHYETSPTMETDEINQAPMCSTNETSLESQSWDIEAPLMANDIVDNMAIPLEDCEMAMEGIHDAYVTGFMESLLDNDEAEMPQDCSYLADLEKDLVEMSQDCTYLTELEKDLVEMPQDCTYLAELEKDLAEMPQDCTYLAELEKDLADMLQDCTYLVELEKDLADAFALELEKDSPELEKDLADAFALEFEKDSPEDLVELEKD